MMDMTKSKNTHLQAADAHLTARLLFRLLPVQVLLAAVGSVNAIVSGLFASNFVGVEAMGAIGLYNPISILLNAISVMLVSGAAILCGEYIGKNLQKDLQNAFSLAICLTGGVSLLFAALLFLMGAFDLTGFMTRDPGVRPLFNRYLLGQAIGIFPLVLGNLLSSFLSLENRMRRTTAASLVYIAANVVLDYLFVKVLHMEAFGLALASSLGLWVFLAIQAEYFISGRSFLRLSLTGLMPHAGKEMLKIGYPGAISYVWQTLRGFAVNAMILAFVGSAGVSAFAASDVFLRIIWAIPAGMQAVSRMLISVSWGEEDRQTLCDIMRTMFLRFLPLMFLIDAAVILLAVPLTRLFYNDPADPVFMMTVWGFRILPLCMPFGIVVMHFVSYWQTSNRQGIVQLVGFLDGVACVAGFTALLIRHMGMNSVYIANVLNGVVAASVVVGYAFLKNRHVPASIEELMVFPADFGVLPEDRLDMSIRSMEEAVSVAEGVQKFCLERGVDSQRANLAGLALEEMAGNVIAHGFTKDNKKHSVDIRVSVKGEQVILRIKDDCIPFDPAVRASMAGPGGAGDDAASTAGSADEFKNFGIRLIYRIARDIRYQNVLGLNVLTIRV
jgi:Na+-driven multidrug efflux pump/anti-sigma regulatory factor (Ser/Thr protein kinase)